MQIMIISFKITIKKFENFKLNIVLVYQLIIVHTLLDLTLNP